MTSAIYLDLILDLLTVLLLSDPIGSTRCSKYGVLITCITSQSRAVTPETRAPKISASCQKTSGFIL